MISLSAQTGLAIQITICWNNRICPSKVTDHLIREIRKRKGKNLSSHNPPIQLPRILEKIFFLLLSSISVNERKLKWRVRRGVTAFLPPPGGPMAPIKLISTNFLKVPENEQKHAQD